MACAKCGGTQVANGRCCLCNKTSNKMYAWGCRKICWRCKDKQEALIAERRNENRRVVTLLMGKEWKKKQKK